MQVTKKNNPKAKPRKIKVILLSISLFIVAIIAVGFLYWTTHKNKIITNEIEKAISKSNAGFYKISYDEMKVIEDAGLLSVSNMKLRFDSAIYASTEQDKMPPMIFNIDIPEMNIVGVKTKKAFLDKEIVGRKLEIKNPVVDLQYTYKGMDSIRNVPTDEVYKQVLGNLDMIQVDSVVIIGAQVKTSNQNTGKIIIDVKDIDLSLFDVRVDSVAYLDSKRYLFAKAIDVNVKRIVWPSPDKLYSYNAENISLNSDNGKLSVKHFFVRPKLNEDAFVNTIPTQDDRLDFSFNNIVFSGLDIQKLFDEYIEAESLTIGGSSFKIYRDLARPRDKKNRVGYYPHQVMDDIPLVFDIRRVNIRNSFVEYKERNHITRQSGKVQFYNLNGTITNFTNDKRTGNKVMKAVVNSSFLNKTKMKTDWTFYLFNPNGRFDVNGTIGSIDGKILNAITKPMGPASIEEGKLNGLTFNLHGNDHSMDGSVKMLYEDLDVALLEKDNGATDTDKKFLTSLIANMVLKNSNPKGNDEVRVQQVHLSRDINRSLFNLCWKTIFQGIQGTVGIKRATAAR